MRIEIAERNDAMVRYFVFDDQGNEIRQVSRDVSAEISEAKERKIGLLRVLAEKEGISRPRLKEALTEAATPAVEGHTHPEFDDFLRVLPEHAHPLEAHEHPHEHPEIAPLAKQLDALIAVRAEDAADVQRQLATHKHPDSAGVGHGHEDLMQRIENTDGLLRALQDAPVKEHAHHEYALVEALAALTNRMNLMESEIVSLKRELRAHGHELPVHEHAVLKHDHPEYAETLDAHIASVSRRKNAVILSQQEVNGKQRIVLEELE